MTSSPNLLPSRFVPESVARDAWVEIDLNSLEFNVQALKTRIKEQAANAQVKMPMIMGVVKADAYGHGAQKVSEVLSACGVLWLGVASADEGNLLREAYCKLPILILSPTPVWAVKKAVAQKLDLTISSINQLKSIIDVLNDTPIVSVHLKVDTGMHRLGLNYKDTKEAISLIRANKELKLVSVFSHLAKANDLPTSMEQIICFERFKKIFEDQGLMPEFYHLASAEAALNNPASYYDMVRIGISLYGLEARTISDNLIPIMTVRGRINQIKTIEKGAYVSYGLTWQAERTSRLANIPIGYADGVDRGLSNKMNGLLHGKLVKQVGTISMDQMLFDITDVTMAKEGDVITLVGQADYLQEDTQIAAPQKDVSLADWACQLDTITYELACRLKTRLPRIYTRNRISELLPQNLLSTK